MGSGITHQQHPESNIGIVNNRHEIINKIEKFIFEIYRTYNTAESLSLLLSTYLANLAFENYIKSLENTNYIHNYKLYQTASNFLEILEDGIHLSQNQINNISKMILDSTITNREIFSDELKCSFSATITSEKFNESNENRQNIHDILFQVKQILLEKFARKKYVSFLYSKYYRNWRATEYGHAIATTADDHTQEVDAIINNASVGDLKKFSSTGCLSTRSIKPNLSFSAFGNIDHGEVEKVLGANNWLSALVAGVEGLVIGFSISTAEKDKHPIFFVNSYFEKLFNITKADILTRPCPLWLIPVSDDSKDTLVSYMNRCQQQTAIIKYPQNNENHLYVVSVKPVFDHTNKYKQVLSMYVDLGLESNIDIDTDEGTKFLIVQCDIVKELMEILPNMTLEPQS